MATRSKNPSNAVVKGAVAGAASVPLVPMVVEAANELGVHVSLGPATLSLASVLFTSLFSYFSRGGRKGESH